MPSPKRSPQKVPRWLAAARARDSGAPGDWLSRALARAGVLPLTEGRHHQVKQMLNAVGLSTLSLHREEVGGLELSIALGGWRTLSDEEVRAKLRFEPRAGGG